MKEISNRKKISMLIIILLLITLGFNLSANKDKKEVSRLRAAIESVPKLSRRPASIHLKHKRRAQKNVTKVYRPEIKEEALIRLHDATPEESSETQENENASEQNTRNNQSDDSHHNTSMPTMVADTNPSTWSPSKNQTSGSAHSGSTILLTNTSQSTPTPAEPSTWTNNPTSSSLSCTASVPEGNYAYPVSIVLSCSTRSLIKYCISTNGCCDPNSSEGATFLNTQNILIGQTDGDYCLSFYGKDSRQNSTSVSYRRYQINRSIPDLYVEMNSRWMQTTEVPLRSQISSYNFSQPNFHLGQINYRTHNISETGDQLSCEEIVSKMSDYTLPGPTQIFAMNDISHLFNNQHLEVPLAPSSLSYGPNYLATYLINYNHAIPSYACSTSIITLSDFEYFENSSISHTGDLIGGFTHYGFYENSFTLPRTPAGESSHTEIDKKMENGLISIFY